jgi:HEAT repeat protein
MDMALHDSDPSVRLLAMNLLSSVEARANIAKVRKQPVIINPADSPTLYQTLGAMLDDRDPVIRARAVTAITLFERPQKQGLERILLDHFTAEQVPSVRARLIQALAEFGMRGSEASRKAVLSGFDDTSGGVREMTMQVAGHLQDPRALPYLIRNAAASDTGTRKSAIGAIAQYDSIAPAYLSQIQELFKSETDPANRSQLESIIARLMSPKTAAK